MADLPTVFLFGENDTPIWGMTVDERTRRIAAVAGLPTGDGAGGHAVLLVNRRFVFDPAWLREFARRPGEMLTIGGVPVIAHCPDAETCDAVIGGKAAGKLRETAYETGGTILNASLRKRERPFAMALTPATVRAAERASYFGAYKGVTDLLTKYLWPEWALVLTRLAARAGISPNMVTAVGAILCVAAFFAFWHGHYWLGMATGLVFMVLDTVDGKLARCTITSSAIGNVLDHGIDLVHPPFWWWAWGVGLAAYGRPLPSGQLAWVLLAIVGGYVVQRVIEGIFMRAFGKMHIHVWKKIDSDFRLITARRNPNMVILFFATLLGRPDTGLVLVAWWTVLSCLFHLVRLLQALAVRARGGAVTSWLS